MAVAISFCEPIITQVWGNINMQLWGGYCLSYTFGCAHRRFFHGFALSTHLWFEDCVNDGFVSVVGVAVGLNQGGFFWGKGIGLEWWLRAVCLFFSVRLCYTDSCCCADTSEKGGVSMTALLFSFVVNIVCGVIAAYIYDRFFKTRQ